MTLEKQRDRLIAARSCFSVAQIATEIRKTFLTNDEKMNLLRIIETPEFRDAWLYYTRASYREEFQLMNIIHRLLHGEDLPEGVKLDA